MKSLVGRGRSGLVCFDLILTFDVYYDDLCWCHLGCVPGFNDYLIWTSSMWIISTYPPF